MSQNDPIKVGTLFKFRDKDIEILEIVIEIHWDGVRTLCLKHPIKTFNNQKMFLNARDFDKIEIIF